MNASYLTNGYRDMVLDRGTDRQTDPLKTISLLLQQGITNDSNLSENWLRITNAPKLSTSVEWNHSVLDNK